MLQTLEIMLDIILVTEKENVKASILDASKLLCWEFMLVYKLRETDKNSLAMTNIIWIFFSSFS